MKEKEMTLWEKARLVTGSDTWHTAETCGVRALFFSDGPAGVRCEDRDSPQDAFNKYTSFPATCIPCGAAVGASFNLPLIEETYAVLGEEAAYFGIDVLLAPAMNLKRIPLGGRNFEYFSEDPYHSGRTAAAAVKGIQSAGVGACVKHFAANNTEFERQSIDARVDETALRELYLRGFEIAVKEGGPLCVMGAYNKLNGSYCCENERLITEILRKEWGYRGLVVSDWGAVHDRVSALEAGCDLAMPCNDSFAGEVETAVERGKLSEDRLDASVARIRELADKTSGKRTVAENFEKGYRMALRLAEDSVVLLKNNGVLPFGRGAKLLAVGRAAKESKYLGGGSAECKAFRVSEPYDALAAYMERAPLYSDGTNAEETLALARGCDAAVVFFSSPHGHDTEGNDLPHMRADKQLGELCIKLAEAHCPVVVALQTGTPVEMPFFRCADAVLQCHLLGEAGGEAVAKILCGLVNPSGKLAETMPKSFETTPCADYDRDRAVMRYSEGMHVGYRYYCTKRENALLPFGYGLSYSEFVYHGIRVERENGHYVAEVELENVSRRAGKEVVQIYVRDPGRDFRELKGFEKTELAAGERKKVRVELDECAFCRYDADEKRWTKKKGSYVVAAARHALDEGVDCVCDVV